MHQSHEQLDHIYKSHMSTCLSNRVKTVTASPPQMWSYVCANAML